MGQVFVKGYRRKGKVVSAYARKQLVTRHQRAYKAITKLDGSRRKRAVPKRREILRVILRRSRQGGGYNSIPWG